MSFNPPYDKIQGYDADGAASSVNPVQVGGKDGSGNIQSILTGTDGSVKVDGSGVTQPVSGTVTVQQGTASSLKVDLSGTAANATAVKVDGSAVTQPVSGTLGITANSSVNVNQVAGTTTDTNSGNKSAGTQRIVLATDQPQLTNALKVDGSAVTQPVSGTVTANLGTIGSAATAAKQDTGNTSLASIDGKVVTAKTADYDTGAGTDTVEMTGIALPASGGAVAGGTSTNPLQVSLANTSANATAVKVDGSAATQPVSGTVTVQQGTASSLKVDLSGTAANATAVKVDGSAVTQPVSGTVTANLGTIGSAATAAKQPALGTAGTASTDVITVQGIASMTAVKVDGSAVTQPVSGTVTANAGSGTMTVDTELPAAAALADAASNPTAPMLGANLSGYNGASWDRLRVPNVFKDMATVTITSITTVWTPAGGKKFRLMGGCFSVSAAGSVLFEDNSGGNTVVRTPKLIADSPYNFDLGNGILSASANNVLKATLSVAGSITGFLYGVEE